MIFLELEMRVRIPQAKRYSSAERNVSDAPNLVVLPVHRMT